MVFTLLLLAGCHDEGVPVIIDSELFDIEYWFVNNGDPNIRAVEVLSLTYYPREDVSNSRFRNFQHPAAFDTLRDTASTKGYFGCSTQLGIYINKSWEQDSVPCWRYFYFSKIDTVAVYQGRRRLFVWPDDTTRTIQMYLDRVGFCKP